MNRRDTLAAMVAFGAVASLPAVRGQSRKSESKPVLGVLSTFPIVAPEQWANSPFWRPLRSLGWIEGQNFQVERASSYPNDDRLPLLAEELVRNRVDVIFAASNQSAVAAARATKNIPIVFWGVNYPVELGLVDSLSRPGGNVTGIALYVGPVEFTKTMDFLKQAAPSAQRLSYVYQADHMQRVDGTQWRFADDYIESAAKRVGFESHQHALSREKDLDAMFADILGVRAQALYVSYSAWTINFRERDR
jgi:putative ABC transport system substrate-binding protein